MSTFRLSTFDAPQRLPDSFEPELVELDAQLAEMHAHAPVPEGLTERVFAASVADLPRTQVERPRLRLVGTGAFGRRAFHWQSWGRVALAASVAIAAILAVAVTRTGQLPDENLIAHSSSAAEVHLASLADWQGASDEMEHDLSYLIESSEMSAEDVTHELAMLSREFGM